MKTLKELLDNHILSREHHMECGESCGYLAIQTWAFGNEDISGLIDRVLMNVAVAEPHGVSIKPEHILWGVVHEIGEGPESG